MQFGTILISQATEFTYRRMVHYIYSNTNSCPLTAGKTMTEIHPGEVAMVTKGAEDDFGLSGGLQHTFTQVS